MLRKIRQKLWGVKLNVKFTVLVLGVVLLPILGFTLYLFRNMEETSINEKKKALEYSMQQGYEQILKNVDSIHMSTEFFLSDQKLMDYLVNQQRGQEYTAEELLNFNNTSVVALERMVNTNPYLYQIRIFVDSENMQEIMPLLFKKERMMLLDWANDEVSAGWKYDYIDSLYRVSDGTTGQKIMSLVTPIEGYHYNEIGILEVSMTMDTMFPMLYEETEGEWSYFLDSEGKCYYSEDMAETAKEYLPELLKNDELANSEKCVIRAQELDGQLMVVGSLYVKELDGHLICVRSLQEVLGKISSMRMAFFIMLAIFLGALAIFINYVVRRMLSQFYDILHAIREVQKGDMDVVIENCGTDEMGELGNQINAMLAHLKRLMEDNIKRELLVKNSEIRALQNQINAHFIYNVLESIKMMAEIDEEYEISDAITNLGKLMRYSMKWTSGYVSVEQEISYIQNYLKLINLRFDYEIYLSLNIPEEIRIQEIPKMSLQPIVENAIYHGIEQMAEDTNIYIKGFQEGEDCIIEITDAGRGMSEEEVEIVYRKISGEIDSEGGSGNGIGLKNVQDRIKMCFGDAYGIEINSKLGCYTKVKVRVPMTKLSPRQK